MNSFLQVAIGGALGSMARHAVNLGAARLPSSFPLGTLTVNILGCLCMGLVASTLMAKGGLHLAPFLMTGILGGFTTFSAFALDSVALWERGALGLALIYVAASVVASLAAVIAGLAIGRGIFA